MHFSGECERWCPLSLGHLYPLFQEHFPGALYFDYKKYFSPWSTFLFCFIYNTESQLIKLL